MPEEALADSEVLLEKLKHLKNENWVIVKDKGVTQK